MGLPEQRGPVVDAFDWAAGHAYPWAMSGTNPGGAPLPTVRHCRHCLGDCGGDCLLPGNTGLCIHKPAQRLTWRERLLLLGNRRWWRRVFRGPRG